MAEWMRKQSLKLPSSELASTKVTLRDYLESELKEIGHRQYRGGGKITRTGLTRVQVKDVGSHLKR